MRKYDKVGMAIYECHIDISIFLNIERDMIFYFTYRYTFDISHQLSVISCCVDGLLFLSSTCILTMNSTFVLFSFTLLSHLISLDQKLKNASIFVLPNFLYVFK